MFQIQWLWKYMGKKRHYLVIALIIAAVTSGLTIVNPMLSQRLIDEVITPQDTALLLPLLLTMLAVQVGLTAARYLMIVLLEKNSIQNMNDIRTRLYGVISHQDWRFFSRMRTGNLMTRMTNDLDMLRHTTAWITYSAVDSVAVFVAALIYLGTVSLPLTLALAAVTPFILVITRFFSKNIRPQFIALREKLTHLSTTTQENIEGNRVVKAFAREEYEKQRFDTQNANYRDASLKTAYTSAKFQPMLDLLSQSLTVITILLGGIFMINGQLTAGQMLAFTSLTWALANPMRNLGMLITDTQRFFAASNMLIEVFYAQPSIVDRDGAVAPEGRIPGDVVFEDVSFSIGEKKVLDSISFSLQEGQTLGILGSTGSGKTSLVNMLTRFFEPESGTVRLGGQEVSHYTLSSLRRAVGVAMQDVFLFSDEVSANIAYGRPDLDMADIEASARAADAHGFITRLSEGYETLVGERGVGLSGGQKQRISLARALAVKPSVLVLDDTTSAVDMETEGEIQAALRRLEFACTKIIIAQRVSSIADADIILVMDSGRVIERGTHEELLARRGYYYNVWALQNDVEEAG